jgi:hypothetical protein
MLLNVLTHNAGSSIGSSVIAALLLMQFHCWCNLKFDTLLSSNMSKAWKV